jgi:hypothetical protein
MNLSGNKPEIGPGPRQLGVRFGSSEHDDINLDHEGYVYPGMGGLSVAPSVDALPPHRLPRRLRHKYPDRFSAASGSNGVHCWWMGEGAFAEQPVANRLTLRLDPDDPGNHGFVEPDAKMKKEDYESALAATCDQWQRWEE